MTTAKVLPTIEREHDEARGSRSERKDHERKDGGANGEAEALRNGRSDDLPPFETLPLHFSVKERPLYAKYDFKELKPPRRDKYCGAL